MKRFSLLLMVAAGLWAKADAQVKFGNNPVTINEGSLLELESTNKGFLPTRVTLTDRLVWGLAGTPVTGMIVYSNALGANGLDTGLVVWQGQWNLLTTTAKTDANYWNLKGNAGTVPPTALGTAAGPANYWGTTDAQNLAVGTNGITRAIFNQNGSLFGGSGNFDANVMTLNSLIWGLDNKDSARNSLMYGQSNSVASTGYASIVGGQNNYLSGARSAVFGFGNNDSALYTLVAGQSNTVGSSGTFSAVFGNSNISNGYANIVGGFNNNIGNRIAHRYNVVGGSSNMLTGTMNGGNNLLLGGGNKIENATANTDNNIVSGNGNKLVNASNAAIFGSLNIDSANYNLVAGQNNVLGPVATEAIVSGFSNTINARGVFAIGSLNTAGAGATASGMFGFGNNVSNSVGSVVLGGSNIISGFSGSGLASNSIVGGSTNVLYGGASSLVIGNFNKDSAKTNIVSGEFNTVRSTAYQSIVTGQLNDVSMPASIVVGASNRAVVGSGLGTLGASAVFGEGNVDSARWSLMAGSSNIATPGMAYGAVVGKYNQPVDNALFTVGTGTGLQRKNALTVLSTQTTGAVVNGNIVFANLPKYNTPADAVADASLPSGAMYFLTSGGPVYVKP